MGSIPRYSDSGSSGRVPLILGFAFIVAIFLSVLAFVYAQVSRTASSSNHVVATGPKGSNGSQGRAIVVPTPRPTPIPPLPRRNRKYPLRLLVTGDSLTGYLGPDIISLVQPLVPTVGFPETHDSTGLARPDFVNWIDVARKQIAADNPDAVVVMMGGNDFQNMTTPTGGFYRQLGTAAWSRAYQQRAEALMRIWARPGPHRVYWLSFPPTRDPGEDAIVQQMNAAVRRAAEVVPGVRWIDTNGPITNHGRYTDVVYQHGQPMYVRGDDGIHISIQGSQIVAQEVLGILRKDWHF